MRLLLADDHVIFRQGLVRLLETRPELEIVAEASDGREALKLIESLRPELAILDIGMPSMTGIEIIESIRSKSLPTRVVLLTMHDEPALALEAEHTGCSGYVLKDRTFEELLKAIRIAASGGHYMSPTIAEKVRAFRSRGGGVTLSPREKEVLKLIISGHTNKVIARELGISPKTVETHRDRLMAKLNLHTVADLVRYGVRAGYLPLDS